MKALTEFKHIIEAHGYSRQSLAAVGAFTGVPIDRLRAAALTESPSPLNALVRMFFLRLPISEPLAAAAVAPFTLSELKRHGLVREDEGGWVGGLAIIPFAGLLTLRDFEPHETGVPLRTDHVLGVGLATSILSTLTVRRRIAHALDIGAGQGFQSMIASGHAARVIGTDINPRAIRVAQLACELNGITNIEWREGSMLEPVSGEAPFDLIVSNPPFIISPPHDLSCLGGASEGDSLVESLLREAPSRLADGGFCTIVFNWHHSGGDDWRDRPRSWLARAGQDAWLIRLSSDSREDYARRWIHEAQLDAHGPAISFDDWVRYFDRLGVGRISMGAAVLRARRAPHARNWFRADELAIDRCDGEAGDQIARIFANQTAVVELPPDELAALSLRITPDHELRERRVQSPGEGWRTLDATLRQTRGFDFEVRIDTHAATLLGGLDGSRPAGEAVAACARDFGADPSHAVRQCPPFLSRMLGLGHLEIA
ncbi:MAG: methyltransferase [Phycisphaerae bacterium]|nr:methyltransferase [Phycisphaerae bacterium]